MSGTTGTYGQFTVGKDIQIVLTGPTGNITLPKITGFHHEPQYEVAKSKVLDGPTRQFSLPDGHKITIKFDREDSQMDDFAAAMEAAYWAVGGFVPQFTLAAYVTERNGSTSRYNWPEFDITYKPGEWKSGAPVSGQIDGFARFFKKVG